MPSSILNSDDGVISGTSGLKSSGGDDGSLKIQTNGTDAASVTSGQVVSFVNNFGTVANLPAYQCRAWVNFNGTGTPAIRASGNVSSITDEGTGQYTVNFTTAMPDANYAASVTASTDPNGGSSFGTFSGHVNYGPIPTTTSIRVRGFADDGSSQDKIYMYIAIFR